MADTIEKVYCTGDGGNDNLAAGLADSARGQQAQRTDWFHYPAAEDHHNHHWSVVGPNKIYQGATRCVISETPFCLFIELSKKSALWNLKIFREITRSIC